MPKYVKKGEIYFPPSGRSAMISVFASPWAHFMTLFNNSFYCDACICPENIDNPSHSVSTCRRTNYGLAIIALEYVPFRGLHSPRKMVNITVAGQNNLSKQR